MHLERQRPSSGSGQPARVVAPPGDFAGFVARNAPPAYRLAAIALDDPVLAQDVVHDALMAAWQLGASWPSRSLDSAFGRRLLEQLRTAIRRSREAAADPSSRGIDGEMEAGLSAPPSGLSTLPAGLSALPADDLLALIEHVTLPGEIEPLMEALGGHRKLDMRLPEILEGLRARAPSSPDPEPVDGDPLIQRISAALGARDPVEEPSQLRWRLQRSLVEAEQALAEQAEIASSSDWGFAIKFFALIVIGVLGVSALSMAALRDQAAAPGDPAQGLGGGLVPARVAVVSPPGETQSIHVAATQDTLVALVEASWQRDRFARGCQPYVEGLVDTTGAAQWLGDIGVSVDLIAGNARTDQAHLIGRDALCARVDMSSSDGGRTWDKPRADASLPESADLLTVDPGRSRLVADAAGHAWSSLDGTTWTQSSRQLRLIGFDTTGRLVAWSGGRLVDSYDDGVTWLDLDAGPASAPVTGAALADGVLLAAPDGLWWHPFDGTSRLIQPGRVLAVQAVADGAVAVGTDENGALWISTISGGIAYPAALPDSLASVSPSSAEVAGNAGGALVALTGPKSAIAFIAFQQ